MRSIPATASNQSLLGKAAPALLLLRPQQWVKNGFVAAPLFFTPSAVSGHNLRLAAAGMLVFCVLSSAVYVFNDLQDRHSDRQHPGKCTRPLAAGTLAIPVAVAMLAALGLGGALAAWALSPGFLLIALLYLANSAAYSCGLKSVSILEALMVALGFVLRVQAGAVLIHVELTAWIIIATGLLALFLALAKRRDDLVRDLGADHRASLAGYTKGFLDVAIAIVLGALLTSYLIYTTDPAVQARLGSAAIVYTIPFVLAGILRYLQVTLVYERSGSPTQIVLTDKGMRLAILGWLIAFAAIVYL